MNKSHPHHQKLQMKYSTFAQMIFSGTIIMFGLMYLNTYSLDHIFFSETRAYMALMMGSVMAFVMLSFMWEMYSNKILNYLILLFSLIAFSLSLHFVRSQSTINDLDYMRAMIPHHSIAILTSERANIADPRVKRLADGIIATQKKEIDEMSSYIEDLESK
jgi:hypothetical protein